MLRLNTCINFSYQRCKKEIQSREAIFQNQRSHFAHHDLLALAESKINLVTMMRALMTTLTCCSLQKVVRSGLLPPLWFRHHCFPFLTPSVSSTNPSPGQLAQYSTPTPISHRPPYSDHVPVQGAVVIRLLVGWALPWPRWTRSPWPGTESELLGPLS